MARTIPAALLAKLGQLADDSLAQVRFAAELLATERRAQLLGPALAALEELPIPEARPPLLHLYSDLDADGIHLDAGGGFRAAALRALRPWATATDLPLLERAVTTYEFLPPGRSEEAAPIRAAGLVILADLDPQLAGFHAARLLVDHLHTSKLSGEPGKTAAFHIDRSLGYMLHLASTRMRQELQRQFTARGYPITMPQWHILNRLWEEEGLTQNDLADRTFRDKTTTARTLALLIEQQLIVRERDTVDRRNYQISLTPTGRALKQVLIPIAAEVIAQACVGFSDEQVAALKVMLAQIYTNFGHAQGHWPAHEAA